MKPFQLPFLVDTNRPEAELQGQSVAQLRLMAIDRHRLWAHLRYAGQLFLRLGATQALSHALGDHDDVTHVELGLKVWVP